MSTRLVYADMRRAAEQELQAYPGFMSIDATAEATTLPDQSVHLITVGNAFHWFNHDRTYEEFLHILVPQGWVVLAWNLERHTGSPFTDAFEQFWQTCIDPSARFVRTRDRQHPDYSTKFFREGTLKETTIDNAQACDFDALKGLVLSMLKSPHEGDPQYHEMLDALQTLFTEHQEHGMVTVDYDTAIVYGQL
jgi:ubiquinone/menaquinone biosynthesis C-methylase UbiE